MICKFLRIAVLLAVTPFLASGQSLLKQAKVPTKAPAETTEDLNQQQLPVPKAAAIPKPPEGYGTIVGQFIYDGDAPKPKLLFKKDDPSAKDGAVCATEDQFENSLVVNSENKGLRNAFFFIRKVSSGAIHPDLQKPQNPIVWFDQQGCRFFPKALLVRTGQEVRVLSNDDANHNTHTFSGFNQQVNFLVGANDREGTPITPPLTKRESVPFEVKCDLHPWMKAQWLVLDHPYMAVSNKNGRFLIANIPEGKHEVRMMHARTGYLDRLIKTAKTADYEIASKKDSRGRLRTKTYITVKSGTVHDLGTFKLKPEWFEDK